MVKEDDYLLTNQEILGGLKAALERGQTLKQAMMSFYQSGYKKLEIEDAARAYLYLQRGNSEVEILNKDQETEKKKFEIPSQEINKKGLFQEEEHKQNLPKINVLNQPEKNEGSISKIKQFFGKKDEEKQYSAIRKTVVPTGSRDEIQERKPEKKVYQKISGYDGKKDFTNFKSKTITGILVISLIVLVGILGLVILFKDELVNFINGLFG